MRKRTLFTCLTLLIVAATFSAQPALVAAKTARPMKREFQFKVRIENISNPEGYAASNGARWPFALSPGLYVADEKRVTLFAEGKRASRGLEAQAEDGNPSGLIDALTSSGHSPMLHAVFNIPVGAAGPAPIGPGGVYEFTLTATPKMKLSMAMMFGQSNDLFYAPSKPVALFDSKGSPVGGDITSTFVLYDAGTERNQEVGIGPDQAPRQAAPNTGEAEKGVVRRATEQPFYTRTGQLFRVTVTPEQAGGM
jgi:hypothetical protein